VKFFGSYESKVIKVAMDALRVTVETVPEGSPEHFPPPAVMKATLKENFFPEQSKASMKKYYGEVKPELGAYHLLDYVGHLFKQHARPDMAEWCFVAKDTLRGYIK